MARIRFWVPDELKERMNDHNEIDWDSVLRRHLKNDITSLDDCDVARAVKTSERLSQEIDHNEVANDNIANVIREFQDSTNRTEST